MINHPPDNPRLRQAIERLLSAARIHIDFETGELTVKIPYPVYSHLEDTFSGKRKDDDVVPVNPPVPHPDHYG